MFIRKKHFQCKLELLHLGIFLMKAADILICYQINHNSYIFSHHLHTCCQAWIAVFREWSAYWPKLMKIGSTIIVQSNSLPAVLLEIAVCPHILKGFTTLCMVTFRHSRSLQSARVENWISWNTDSSFHWRRYTWGSSKETIMYSSSDGTFLSDKNGCRNFGGAEK